MGRWFADSRSVSTRRACRAAACHASPRALGRTSCIGGRRFTVPPGRHSRATQHHSDDTPCARYLMRAALRGAIGVVGGESRWRRMRTSTDETPGCAAHRLQQRMEPLSIDELDQCIAVAGSVWSTSITGSRVASPCSSCTTLPRTMRAERDRPTAAAPPRGGAHGCRRLHGVAQVHPCRRRGADHCRDLTLSRFLATMRCRGYAPSRRKWWCHVRIAVRSTAGSLQETWRSRSPQRS
jgi:hypothetical protein